MRSRSAAAVLGVVLFSAAPVSRRTPNLLQPNPNTERAGSLRDGVLTIALEAKESAWRLNGATRPPMTIEAFSEVGKAPLMPGPLVRAPQGTEIHATEGGRVAYAGNELKGYGNLVLIRHDNGWVSAYAHAEEILVKRDDVVKRGQVIAKAGKTGTVDQPQLHFELRQGARPVDPMPHLER